MKNVSIKIRFSRNVLLFKFQDSVGNGNRTLRKQLEKCYGVIGMYVRTVVALGMSAGLDCT